MIGWLIIYVFILVCMGVRVRELQADEDIDDDEACEAIRTTILTGEVLMLMVSIAIVLTS